MDDQRWKVVDEQEIYCAPPWIELNKQTVSLPSGKIIDDYHRLSLPDFVASVVFTPDDHVVMIDQYKHGVGKMTLSLPGGMVDAGEDPQKAAARELEEETGFTAQRWVSMGSYTVHGNLGAGRGHYFIAHEAHATAVPNSGDLEEMKVLVLPREEIQRLISQGNVCLLNHITGLALAGLTPQIQ